MGIEDRLFICESLMLLDGWLLKVEEDGRWCWMLFP